jgi:hypothetical protein
MEPHEVMRAVLKSTGAKQIASGMDLSLSLVYKWGEPPVDGQASGSPLDRVGQIVRISKDPRVAQWVCEQADGFFVRNEPVENSGQPLIPLTTGIVQGFADMLSYIAKASADNVITSDEAKLIRRRWEDVKSVTEGFVRGAEGGHFRPKEPPPDGKAPVSAPDLPRR